MNASKVDQKSICNFKEDKISAVEATTLSLCILLVSLPESASMQTDVMTRRLYAAEPTMVPGPRGPAWKLWPTVSMIESKISGADVPSAIRVRLATVSFHIRTSITSGSSSCRPATTLVTMLKFPLSWNLSYNYYYKYNFKIKQIIENNI